MKRYSNMNNCSLFAEDLQGEWVKYKDVCDLLNNLGHSVSVVGFHDRIKRLETHLQPGIKTPECNCAEESVLRFKRPEIYQSWICPAHGYKKR